MTLEELEVVINANTKQFNEQVAQVQNKVDSMASSVNSSVDKMSGTFDKLGKILASVFAIGAITKFTKSCLDLGSSLTEVQNVVDVTFGSMSDRVNEFAKGAWKTIGLSETMAKQYMGNFGAMAKAMGFATSEAEKMAETLTTLTGDVTSFFDNDPSEAYTKLKSVFTGETESLKELGVVMTQENLNQYALANGYGKTIEKMNQQEKVALRLAYVTQTLSAANGDFARTSNTWANQVRLLSLQYQSFKASIGQGLIAVLTPVINIINTIMAKLVQMANTFNSVLSAIGFNITSGNNSFFGGSTSGIDVATDAMENLGGATDGVGKKADKAKKKIEALMGIDEINKVNSNNDSGSGGSGGVGSIASPAVDTSATEDSLSAFNDRVNKILSELLSPLRKAWDNYGEWFLSKWDYFKKAFGYNCDELKRFLISVWNHGGKEFVQHMAEIGIVVGGVALQIGGDILVALGRLWNHLNPDNNPYTRKFINAMNSLAIAARDFIISAGSWFGKFLDLGGQAFINVIGDIVVLVGTILAKIMADAINFITAFMNSWAGSVIIGAVAITLNIVAVAIKAVIVVIEKCRYVLEALLVLWTIWKVQNISKNILVTENAVGKLFSKLSGLAASVLTQITLFKEWSMTLVTKNISALKDFANKISTDGVNKMVVLSDKIKINAKEFISWSKNIITHPITSIKTLGSNIKGLIISLKEQTIELVKSAAKWVADTASKVANTVATKAHTLATNGAIVAQSALNLAMKACPIILLVSLIAGLVVVVKKIGDKFGWWADISNALGKVLGWIGEKVGWLWDKIKSFFGWDETPAVEENIEGIGTAAEETAKTTDSAFGTATSNVNKYLDSIHFNATRLAAEVDEATKAANEKFGMLSQSAQDYLDAIVNNDAERLAQMGENQTLYNEEVKAMYGDLTEAEKNEFMKRYGILQGINDDMLNYEGLKYDERVARHAAYLSTIEADESLSYQEKKAKMDQANLDFQASIDSEVQKYQESIAARQQALDELLATHGNTTGQGQIYEQDLRDAIAADREAIEQLTKTSYDSQVTTAEEATGSMAKANEDNVAAQEETYKSLASTVDESMVKVNESLKGARENIESFTKDAKNLASQLKNSFNGVGAKISSEFTMAGSSISTTIRQIQALVSSSTSGIRSTISSSFSSILQTVVSMLDNIQSIYKSSSMNMINITNNVVSLVLREYQTMNSYTQNYFNSIRNNSSSAMNDVYRNVSTQLQNIRNLFNNFDATLRVKVPHFYMHGDFNAETKEVPRVGVNYFAKGGIVDRATLGIVGEAGREAIMPLENNTGWITDLAEKVSTRMPQSNSNNSFGDGDLTLIIDGSVIGKVALKQLRKMQRQGNITLIPT